MKLCKRERERQIKKARKHELLTHQILTSELPYLAWRGKVSVLVFLIWYRLISHDKRVLCFLNVLKVYNLPFACLQQCLSF